MVQKSFSKLVSTAKSASVQASATSSKVISKVSSKSAEVVRNGSKATSDVTKKLKECCNPNNLIPCITAIVLIIYIVVVNPDTVLEMFSTHVGKLVSMFVVLVALLFDIRLGVMLGLAVVLSINMASANRELYESYTVAESDNEADTYMPVEKEFQDEVAKEAVEQKPVMDVEYDDVELKGGSVAAFDAEDSLAPITDFDDKMMS